MNSDVKIVCPECFSNLDDQGKYLVCVLCGEKFLLKEGIPSFTELNPLFEGRFIGQLKPSRFENRWFYPILENVDIGRRRIAFLKKCLKPLSKKSLILDIGCGGGGWGLTLNKYGNVAGMDVSMSSLRNAKSIYKDVVHASINRIPFPSNYFDAVVSSDVIGHIPYEEKAKAFSEMYRALKPGGFMIHAAIETDSNSVWFQFAKKYPDLFKTHHINKHGHIGLELPSVIIDRCKEIGFEIKKVEKMHALVLYPELLLGWFDNEYKSKSGVISVLVAISRKIERVKVLNQMTKLTLGSIETIMNHIINVNQATGLLICCRK